MPSVRCRVCRANRTANQMNNETRTEIKNACAFLKCIFKRPTTQSAVKTPSPTWRNFPRPNPAAAPAPQPAAPAASCRSDAGLCDVLPAATHAAKEVPAHDKQRGANARKIFRAILEFLDRCLTTKSVLSVTGFLLIGSWAYPPGYHPKEHSHGWFFLFDMSSVMRVDFGRLFLLDAIIGALGGWLAFVCRGERARSTVTRVALYSLVAIPIVAIVWSVVAHIGYVMWQADRQHARDAPPATLTDSDFMQADQQHAWVAKEAAQREPWKNDPIVPKHAFDPSTARPEVEPAFDPDKFLNARPAPVRRKPAFDPTKPWEAAPIVNDSDGAPPPGFVLDSDVRNSAPDIRKNITLLDIAPNTLGKNVVTGFHGTIRNGLAMAVERIALKASFYNPTNELIETHTFGLKVTVPAGAPVSFDETSLGARYLPDGWTWKLEIVEAHYVK